jgi:hypothetical protein
MTGDREPLAIVSGWGDVPIGVLFGSASGESPARARVGLSDGMEVCAGFGLPVQPINTENDKMIANQHGSALMAA